MIIHYAPSFRKDVRRLNVLNQDRVRRAVKRLKQNPCDPYQVYR